MEQGNHNGERDGKGDTQNDERDVIKNRVTEHDKGVRGLEEETKIIKAHPIAQVQALQEISAQGAELFERDDDTEHGQITKD